MWSQLSGVYKLICSSFANSCHPGAGYMGWTHGICSTKRRCENSKHSQGLRFLSFPGPWHFVKKRKHKPLPDYPSQVISPLLKYNALFNKPPNEHNNQMRPEQLQEAIKTNYHKMGPRDFSQGHCPQHCYNICIVGLEGEPTGRKEQDTDNCVPFSASYSRGTASVDVEKWQCVLESKFEVREYFCHLNTIKGTKHNFRSHERVEVCGVLI